MLFIAARLPGLSHFVLVIAMLAALASCDDTTPEENALLWRIERQGHQTSYLFGTLHVATPDIADPAPAVREALLAVEQFAGETDLQMLNAVFRAEAMMAPVEERVHRILDAELLERTVSRAHCYGLSPDEVRTAPIWYVVSLFTLAYPESDPELRDAPILDLELARIAEMAGMPVLGLETEPQVLAVLRDMDREDQIGLLREVTRRGECFADEADVWLERYRQGDLAGLDQLQEDWLDTVEDPALWRRFFQWLDGDRNPRMADRMEYFMKAGSSFFAVGAAHLTGKDGLIALLRQRGWSVEPVK